MVGEYGMYGVRHVSTKRIHDYFKDACQYLYCQISQTHKLWKYHFSA
jgi:hypothetical protein